MGQSWQVLGHPQVNCDASWVTHGSIIIAGMSELNLLLHQKAHSLTHVARWLKQVIHQQAELSSLDDCGVQQPQLVA